MGRNNATFSISGNFEPSVGAPFDNRQLTSLKSDLTSSSTWEGTYVYSGMLVVVWEDSDNNGLYRLSDSENYTNEASWIKIAEEGSSSFVTAVQLAEEIQTVTEEISKKQDILTAGDNIVIEGSTISAITNNTIFYIVDELPEASSEYLNKIYLVPNISTDQDITASASVLLSEGGVELFSEEGVSLVQDISSQDGTFTEYFVVYQNEEYSWEVLGSLDVDISSYIVQETGDNTDKVMSQAAVTNELTKLRQSLTRISHTNTSSVTLDANTYNMWAADIESLQIDLVTMEDGDQIVLVFKKTDTDFNVELPEDILYIDSETGIKTTPTNTLNFLRLYKELGYISAEINYRKLSIDLETFYLTTQDGDVLVTNEGDHLIY